MLFKSARKQEEEAYDKNQAELNKRKEELKIQHGIHM